MTRSAAFPIWIARRLALAMIVLVLGLGATVPLMTQAAAGAELIMFDDVGCPWCRRWDQDVGEAYSRSEEGHRAPLRRIHISEAQRAGVKLATAVTVTPTFVLVDQGAEIGRITGYPGPEFFWAMIEQLIARLPKAAPQSGSRDARHGEAATKCAGCG